MDVCRNFGVLNLLLRTGKRDFLELLGLELVTVRITSKINCCKVNVAGGEPSINSCFFFTKVLLTVLNGQCSNVGAQIF